MFTKTSFDNDHWGRRKPTGRPRNRTIRNKEKEKKSENTL